MKLFPFVPLAAATALLLAACASRGNSVDKAMKQYNKTFDGVDKAMKKDKKANSKFFNTGENNSSW